MIAICILQIEASLVLSIGAMTAIVVSTTSLTFYSYRKADVASIGFGRSDDRAELGLGFKEFLSKEEAGAVVLMSREAAGKKVAFNHYDPVVPELVKTNDNDVAKYVMVYQYALDTIPDGYDTTVSG